MEAGASASFLMQATDEICLPQKDISMSQPLNGIRLATYLPELARQKSLKFGLFRVRSPLLTESLVIFSSSGY
jgi:hypothetical protein